jgi:hypothetical protein
MNMNTISMLATCKWYYWLEWNMTISSLPTVV